jgi:hypothetical protein
MDDALPLGCAGRRDAEAGRGQGAQDRRSLPAYGGMRGDAGRFVDDDDLVIVVHDAELRHRDRNDARLLLGLPVDVEPRACTDTIGLAHRPSIEHDASARGDLGREGPGEAQHLGERGVHTFAVEPVGYGQPS